jgi:tRNA A-37 threonylcarbamoyl transferase component Bud32
MIELVKSSSCTIYLHNDVIYKNFKNYLKYKTEKDILESLQDMPNIIPFIGFNNKDKTILLKYIPMTLENMINKIKNKEKILKQCVSFINNLHKRNIAHNDFKAKNILIDDDENIYVIDFEMSTTHTQNFISDDKKLKFLKLQILFGIDYKTSYTKYKEYNNYIMNN